MNAPGLEAVEARYRRTAEGAAPLVTRFAPSPTGELHLGHVLHAEWVWGVAGALGATVLVRVEDHDRARCRPEFERAILHDLEWLGFKPERTSRASLESHPSPFRQSDHAERYAAAFDRLRGTAEVYGCSCTRSMMAQSPIAGQRRYPGTCRGFPLGRTGRTLVRVPIPDEEVRIDDLLLGAVVQHPQRDLGDVAVRDGLGQWTYQFSVAVDDLHDGVNLIIRGEDLLPSSGTQWLLARMLGRAAPPLTVHHPLLVGADGKKLGKRDRSETVRAMRERGMTAADVRARAVAASGEATPSPR